MDGTGGRPARFRRLSWGLLVGALGACNLDNPGITPPEGQLTFPIALELSSETDDEGQPRYLYVVNSNFDLRYNAGSVQSYDLEALERQLDMEGCLAASQVSDAGILDAGPSDASNGDAASDAGMPMADADLPDAAPADADLPDADLPDADGLDADVPDGSGLDPDADVLDADVQDAGADAALDAGDAAADEPEAEDGGAPGEGEAGMDAGEDTPDYLEPWDFTPLPPYDEEARLGLLCDGRDGDPAVAEACCFDSNAKLASVREDELLIDSYASGAALAPDGERLYVPVRSRNRLVYIDLADGQLECGGEEGRCTRGPDVSDRGDAPDARLPPSPLAVTSGRLNELGFAAEDTYVMMAHERGQVSLLVERGGAPVLQDVLTSGLLRPTSLRVDGLTNLAYVTSAISSQIDRLGARRGEGRYVLYRSSPVFFGAEVTQASDVRDVEVYQHGEDGTIELAALVRGSAGSPIQSLVFVRFDDSTLDTLEAEVIDLTRVGQGPSKLVAAELGGRRLLLVSCYDAGAIYVVDAGSRELVHVIREFSGPFEMRVDAARQLLYVADFRASVVRVVDIRGLVDASQPPPRIVATLGSLYFGGGLN